MYWIKKFIDYQRLTVFSFEKKLGIRGTIDKAIKNKSSVRSDLLSKILEEFPNISAYWLITGKGEMLAQKNDYGVSNDKTVHLVNESEIEYGSKTEVYELQKQMIDTQSKLIEQLQQKIDEMQSKDAS